MAYEKQTWKTGDVITQEKLNHMEDGIEDAYELPAVTETDNGKVLGVENGAWSVVNGGGGCDCGFECTETVTELFNETVTTVAQSGVNAATLAYSEVITADTLIVTFDGVEYTCPKQSLAEGVNVYGDFVSSKPGFSEIPFAIQSMPAGNIMAMKTAGEHTVSAASVDSTIETTECFEKAVQKANSVLVINKNKTEEGDEDVFTLDKTWQEIFDACSTRGVIVKDVTANNNALIPITQIRGGFGTYSVILLSDEYTTETPNGYPTNGGGK